MVDCHKCDVCNKLYSSYKSLWKHNKNIHKSEEIKKCQNVVINIHKTDTNSHNIDIYYNKFQ